MKAKIVEAQVFVTDLARAEKFYSEVLGFELQGRSASWLAYDAGLEFIVMAGAGRAKQVDEYGKSADTVICLEVEGIEAWAKRLKDLGVHLYSEVQTVPQGKFVGFRDPDGNLFELIERASKG